MATISELVWPPTNVTLTYEEHREKLTTLGVLHANTIIKSDDSITVEITNDNIYTFRSNLILKSIKTTIDETGKIYLGANSPCYGIFEIMSDTGFGFIELDLYETPNKAVISEDKLIITVMDQQFYNPSEESPIYIKILTIA